uniref:Ribonuclease H-like domain, reverse transcriptase, RNA-dependent DNA polymerase n=1 Tax=Tanacetum cinerariifolium TaxID=118510 RepID=A0A699I3L8_TANCI|nr:ribonuclease H-like domain, reverse transcriptase, RNA-dependent DNA polymerase [Tanacetum cinerariifolium]
MKKRAIGTKCVFKNKKDERRIVIRNKARFVAQWYTQEEGIKYDEVCAPVARIKAIMLFLAYASFKDFVVYQMDVKSAFLYGKIDKEVYVCQPPGFEDPDILDRVYKVEKALYGLHQAPKTWYETLSTYLLGNGLQRGKIDKTLFIKRQKGDILLVQVYMDDIIFSSTKKELCIVFERSMIGSLMYLTSSRPDIMFSVCACARYQVNPKVSHLHAVKKICRYLKGQLKLGLWYLKDSLFDLVAYTDSDYAGASLDRKSTTNGCQFLGCRLILWQCKKQIVGVNSITKAEYVAALSCRGQVLWIQNQLLDYGLVRASTATSTLEAEQDSGNITKTQSKATPNEPSSQGTDSGGGPRVLDLEQIKTTQKKEKLEKKNRLRTHGLKRLYKVGLSTKVESSGDEESLGVCCRENKNVVKEVVDDAQVSTAATTITTTTKEITLAQALEALKTTKPKVKGIVFQEPDCKHKNKKSCLMQKKATLFQQLLEKRRNHFAAKSVEEKRNKPPTQAQHRKIMCTYLKNMEGYTLKQLRLVEFDRIQEMFDRAFRRLNTFEDFGIKLVEGKEKRAGEELVQEITKKQKKKATLFQQLLEKRRNHFAAKSVEEKRNKPPTQAQHRKIMCTYLKNMEGYTLKQLRLVEFDRIQEMFDRAFRRLNTFEDFGIKLVEGKEKRAGEELVQEITKKQKVEDDKEKDELKQLMETIPEEKEVTIDAIPLVVKSLRVVDWKIHKEGKKSYYQIVRADEKS